MRAKITIADYMAKHIVTLKKETNILTAIKQLLSHKMTSAPVLNENGYLLGIFSKKDCMKVALETTYNEGQVGSVAEYMATRKLVGMISRADVLKALATIL